MSASYRFTFRDKLQLTSRVSLPSFTAVNSNGNIVSSPGNPAGAFSFAFSSSVCGAITVSGCRGVQHLETIYH